MKMTKKRLKSLIAESLINEFLDYFKIEDPMSVKESEYPPGEDELYSPSKHLALINILSELPDMLTSAVNKIPKSSTTRNPINPEESLKYFQLASLLEKL